MTITDADAHLLKAHQAYTQAGSNLIQAWNRAQAAEIAGPRDQIKRAAQNLVQQLEGKPDWERDAWLTAAELRAADHAGEAGGARSTHGWSAEQYAQEFASPCWPTDCRLAFGQLLRQLLSKETL